MSLKSKIFRFSKKNTGRIAVHDNHIQSAYVIIYQETTAAPTPKTERIELKTIVTMQTYLSHGLIVSAHILI